MGIISHFVDKETEWQKLGNLLRPHKSCLVAGGGKHRPSGLQNSSWCHIGLYVWMFPVFHQKVLASSSLSFSFPPSLLPPFPKPRNPGRQGKGYIPILWIWKVRLTEVQSFVGNTEGRNQWHVLGSLVLVCVPLPGPVRQVQ